MLRISNHLENHPIILDSYYRNEIYDIVSNNPGIHFREIVRMSEKQLGTVQYHLKILTKSKFISFLNFGKYKCYFKFGEFNILNIIKRRPILGEIYNILSKKDFVSAKEIRDLLNLSSQRLSYHIKILKNLNLIEEKIIKVQKYYKLI